MLYLLAKKPMACFTTYVLLLPINPSDAPCFDTPPTPCHRISPARVCYNISALLVYSVNCHRDLLSSTKMNTLFFHNWIPQCSPHPKLSAQLCFMGTAWLWRRIQGQAEQKKRQGTNHHRVLMLLGTSQYPPSVQGLLGASQLFPGLSGRVTVDIRKQGGKNYHQCVVNFLILSSQKLKLMPASCW